MTLAALQERVLVELFGRARTTLLCVVSVCAKDEKWELFAIRLRVRCAVTELAE